MLLGLKKFTTRSICRVTKASADTVSYVQRLMHSEKGRRHLLEEKPGFRRKPVSEAHVRAVKAVMRAGGALFDSAWKVKMAVE